MNRIPISYSQELQNAREQNLPLLALESTIITHGMPYPENKDTALLLEETVRAQGAIPATIAVMDGEICVGLSEQKIDALAKQGSDNLLKISTKDIPYALLQKCSGGTTVAATMYIAHLAGIEAFATGGIGGVHRGAETSFDISADLDELARTPVAVICSGAKSILDLRLTLEYLETKAVPAVGYKTKKLPAFYTSSSEFDLDITLDSVEQLAEFMQIMWSLGKSTTGLVIANPIPDEYSLDQSYIQSIIEEALSECATKGIVGKACTPFLLEYIAERTEKKSLFSNIQLVKNNAELGGKLAVSYKALQHS